MTTTEDPTRVWARISGRVQGVAFRFYTVREAERLGLSGWVRNLSDGSVELEAEGARVVLESLISWCQQGPAMATVVRVEHRWEDPSGEYRGFTIRH